MQLVKDLKAHAQEVKELVAWSCLYIGCDFDKSDKTDDDLVIHLINNHTTIQSPRWFRRTWGSIAKVRTHGV